MKSHRAEGQKSGQVKGGLASSDREPLFPRLHVNETEKAGPKAPPRNKMALYEQFTVPSHRFVQPTQTSPTTAIQQQQYGSGYPYMPYYISSVPYANANNNVQAYPQPSQVTSSSAVTGCSMVVNDESQKAHRFHKVGNLSPCKVPRGWTQASAECITSDAPEQREKFGSSPINYMGEPTKAFGNAPTERPYTSDSLHEAISTLKEGMEVMHQRCDGRSVDGRDGSKLLSSDVSVSLNRSTPSTKPTKEGFLAKLPTGGSGYKQDSVTQALTADGHCSMHPGTFSEHRSSEDSEPILATDSQNLSVMEGQVSRFAFMSNETSRTQSHYSALQTSLSDVKKEDTSRGVDLGNHDNKSAEELNKKHVVSQPACSGRFSVNPADVTPVIKPKDVILAIGQQQFWKARKTLLRQQRIFSEQVFQLHKLIMIQQLLAETPGTLIDEAVHFEMLEECDDPPAAALLSKMSSNPGDSRKVTSSQLDDAEGSRTTLKDAKKEVKVSIPDPVQGGGISAWGYPSCGQWIGSMAVQGQLVHGQPYGYQPLAGTFSPGSAFGLPYGSGPASPMVSFGIPYCGQRQELPAEMGSNYGPITTSKLDGRNVGHFSNSFGGSWYFMQHNYANPQMIHAAGSDKDAPTGSGTSVNKAPKTAAQGVKTSSFPGLSYHWGFSNQGARPLNTEGLESSGQQSEISSPSIGTRLNSMTTPITPSAPAVKKLGFSHKGLGKIFDSADSKRSLDKEDIDARACAKVRKEGGSPFVEDVSVVASVHSAHVGDCVLELFPLVPSLSAGGRNGERDPKAVEGGGGHVIRAVPRKAIAASESAAGILLSLQRERQK